MNSKDDSEYSTVEALQLIINDQSKQIQLLQNKLKAAEEKIRFLESQRKKKFVKLENFQNYDNEEIQVTNKNIDFHIKSPLDTANIQEINNSLSTFKKNIPRPSDFSIGFRPSRAISLPKKKAFPVSDKTAPQSTLNFYSQLDEMIFSSGHDKNNWNNTITNIRKNSKLLGSLINQENNTSKEMIMKNSKSRKQDFQNTEKITEKKNKFRPISADSQFYWRDIDWSQTVLDTYASKALFEFNFARDQSIFFPNEIEDALKKGVQNAHWESFYAKAIKTLDRLVQELALPRGFFMIPPKSIDSLEILMHECSKLFRARALVMKILGLIHKREDLLLRIMRYEEENNNLKNDFLGLIQISQEILQSIGYLSQMGLNLGEFLYLGENYSNKILQDNANIKELFPGLKKLEDL